MDKKPSLGQGDYSLCLPPFPSDIIEKYVTVDGYTAEEDDEISLTRGLGVDVLQKSLDGWWLVRCEGKTGLAPATFLKKAPEQQIEGGQVRA